MGEEEAQMTALDANTKLEQAFLQLIEEKPFGKITVNDIVERAGVHRNTFYYHYQSIPALLQEICNKMAEKMISVYEDLRTPADCVLPLVRLSLEHRTAVSHIYYSDVRNIQMDFVRKISRFSIEHYIDNVTERTGIGNRDKETMTRFFTAGLVGVWTEWVEDGMDADPSDVFVRIGTILEKMTLETYLA